MAQFELFRQDLESMWNDIDNSFEIINTDIIEARNRCIIFQDNDDFHSIKKWRVTPSAQLIKFKHMILVKSYVYINTKQLLLFIPHDIKTLILYFYAKPLMIRVKYINQIKEILYCPVYDDWISLKQKIFKTFNLSSCIISLYEYYLVYKEQEILISSPSTWKLIMSEWNESETLFVRRIDNNIPLGLLPPIMDDDVHRPDTWAVIGGRTGREWNRLYLESTRIDT